MSNKITKSGIINATTEYVTTLQDYNIALLIETFIPPEKLDDVYIFPYPGLKNFSSFLKEFELKSSSREKKQYTKKNLYKIKTLRKWWYYDERAKNKYLIGIFAIPLEGDSAHYVAVYREPNSNIMYLWDSAHERGQIKQEVYYIVSELFPMFTIKYVLPDGCNECYQRGAGAGEINSIESQNIFCHTWCLWFCYRVLNEKDAIDKIQSGCKSQEVNLKTIKKFAYNNIIPMISYSPTSSVERWHTQFQYYINPKGDIKSIFN